MIDMRSIAFKYVINIGTEISANGAAAGSACGSPEGAAGERG